FRIVGLKRRKDLQVDIPDMPALENRAVPRAVADRAFIDEPGIEFAAIGVEPGLAAGLEGPHAAAMAAGDEGLGSRSWNNGPLDTESIGHAVLIFLLEVQQEGCQTVMD
ncbi:hypothetical protein MKW35_16450, partial [Aestuariibaculum sp. L182]|nr:hypothetical protein [Aestuariibaculum lutulentum]